MWFTVGRYLVHETRAHPHKERHQTFILFTTGDKVRGDRVRGGGGEGGEKGGGGKGKKG